MRPELFGRVVRPIMLVVLLTPWIVGFSDSHAAVVSHIAFTALFAPVALLIVVWRPAAFGLLAGGCWLALSPWILDYAADHLAWLTELVSGLGLICVGGAAASLMAKRSPRPARIGRGTPAQSSHGPNSVDARKSLDDRIN
jgi:hypothetical protein